MPAPRRLDYAITDTGQLLAALDREAAALGAGQGAATRAAAGAPAPARAALRRAMLEARARFQPSHFVEVGIGCEACHGGGRQHVDDPRRVPTFAPRALFLDVKASSGTPPTEAEWQNRTCARCHQVLFSRYARTWEGGSRRHPEEAGGSHITSGEARDFLLGGCARAMRCATCHDPHREDAREHLAQLATPAGNGVCTSCHRELGTPEALRHHAHHDPVGAGGACVACHMPRKNMGLGYALTRYHRIGSPTDKARVENDRPLECAVCHGDKTVGALLDDMARLWGKRYDAAAIDRLYGGRDQNVLLATITRGFAHEQATAMALAGERRLQAAGAAIAHETTSNAYPLVRLWAGMAQEALAGRRPSAEVENAAAAAGAAHAGTGADDEDWVAPALFRDGDLDVPGAGQPGQQLGLAAFDGVGGGAAQHGAVEQLARGLAGDRLQELLERHLVREARLEGVQVLLVRLLAQRRHDLVDLLQFVLGHLAVRQDDRLHQTNQGRLLVFVQVFEFHRGTIAARGRKVKCPSRCCAGRPPRR